MGKWRNLWNNWQQTLKQINESSGQLDPGPGIRIQDGFVSARVDNSTIEVDGDNNLHVIGGGSDVTKAYVDEHDAALQTQINNKLDKRTTGKGLYSHNGDEQGEVEVATSITGNADKLPTDAAVKTYVDNIADDKADKSTTYTKTEVDTELAKKLTATEADRGLNITNNKVGHSNSITAGTKGSTIAIPKITYDAQGHITEVAEQTVYPPTTAGTNGQYWKSDGSGQGVWATPQTSITSTSTDVQVPSAKAVYDHVATKSTVKIFNISVNVGSIPADSTKDITLTFNTTDSNCPSVDTMVVLRGITPKEIYLKRANTYKAGSQMKMVLTFSNTASFQIDNISTSVQYLQIK